MKSALLSSHWAQYLSNRKSRSAGMPIQEKNLLFRQRSKSLIAQEERLATTPNWRQVSPTTCNGIELTSTISQYC